MAKRISFLVVIICSILLMAPQANSLEYNSPPSKESIDNSARVQQFTQATYIGALSLSFTSTANFGNQGSCSGKVELPVTITQYSNGTGEITVKNWEFWDYFDNNGNCNDQGMVPRHGYYAGFVAYASDQFIWETLLYRDNKPIPGSQAVIFGPISNNNLTASGQSRYSEYLDCCGHSTSIVINYQINALNQQTLPADPTDYIILNVEEPVPSSHYSGVANIRGWSVAPTGIHRVQLYLDGAYITDIPSGGLRTDVGNAYPAYPNSDQSGFSVAYNYSSLNGGQHEIKIRVTDNKGASKEVSVPFEVVRFLNPFVLDPGKVSFANSRCTMSANSINLNNMTVDGIGYDTVLQWRTASQGLEFISIVPNGR